MKKTLGKVSLSIIVMASALAVNAQACTRVMCKEGDRVITSRSMDWKKNIPTALWIFPKGMNKYGGIDKSSLTWTSKYGSVVAVGYDAVTSDGMNEKGLVANLLWLGEANYGKSDNPTISIGAFAQYVLDNYANVEESVNGLKEISFQIKSASLPGNQITLPKGTPIPTSKDSFIKLPKAFTLHLPTSMHLAISDASGDSAVVEFIKGEMVIHHDKKYKVVTNSPTFEKQLAINSYWKEVGGNAMLPGTHRPADRFVRASFYTNHPVTGKQATLYNTNERMAVSKAFSIIREASVPLGVSIPLVTLPNGINKPFDIVPASSTIWRTISDQKALKYYFDGAVSPSTFWVDIKKLDLSKGSDVKKLDLSEYPIYSGEVSSKFINSKPFDFLTSK
jgi:penicillin V acylase-like amidase (Ntn superfamily)